MKLTVIVITYNHERFIAQALESVLMQKVNFEFEVVISEDRSTDRTRQIVTEFARSNPSKIRLLLSQYNLHSNEVVVRAIQASQGQYVALLDGDDYWTSADKLQKQVDFLDNHPECSVCFHNAQVVHEDGSRSPWNWTSANQKEFSTLEDIWMDNFIAACSTMFRKGLIITFPQWFNSLFPITDWPLHILNAEHGKIGYINEVMGVYRYHRGGLYSSLSEGRKLDETLSFYETMDVNLKYRYHEIIRKAIFSYFHDWAQEYALRGDFANAKMCFRRCFKGIVLTDRGRLKKLFRLGLRLHLPQYRSSQKSS
jgi:glycosyltransferase involved in cell wall biosynthesis